MIVVPALISWQLLQSELPLGCCAYGLIFPSEDDASEAVHKTCIFACQGRNGLLFLPRYIAGLLEEAPTQLP
jgi:hypothetical protein